MSALVCTQMRRGRRALTERGVSRSLRQILDGEGKAPRYTVLSRTRRVSGRRACDSQSSVRFYSSLCSRRQTCCAWASRAPGRPPCLSVLAFAVKGVKVAADRVGLTPCAGFTRPSMRGPYESFDNPSTSAHHGRRFSGAGPGRRRMASLSWPAGRGRRRRPEAAGQVGSDQQHRLDAGLAGFVLELAGRARQPHYSDLRNQRREGSGPGEGALRSRRRPWKGASKIGQPMDGLRHRFRDREDPLVARAGAADSTDRTAHQEQLRVRDGRHRW